MNYRKNIRYAVCWLVDKRENGKPSAFGRSIGASRQNVYAWQRGKYSPDIDTLVEISRVYKVSLDWIAYGDSEKAPDDYVPDEYVYEFMDLDDEAQG